MHCPGRVKSANFCIIRSGAGIVIAANIAAIAAALAAISSPAAICVGWTLATSVRYGYVHSCVLDVLVWCRPHLSMRVYRWGQDWIHFWVLPRSFGLELCRATVDFLPW